MVRLIKRSGGFRAALTLSRDSVRLSNRVLASPLSFSAYSNRQLRQSEKQPFYEQPSYPQGPKLAARSTSKQLLRRIPSSQTDSVTQLRHAEVIRPCTVVSTCEQYDLPKVVDLLHGEGHVSASIFLANEVAHVIYPVSLGSKSDILILSNGTVVAWGMNETETREFCQLTSSAEKRPYSEYESEDVDYVIRNQPGKSFMEGDVIYIQADSEKKKLLEMVAFASGLSRSTKLAVLETGLEHYIDSTKFITDQLATGKRLSLQNSEVLKKTGQLLRIRGNLNLYSELTETPDLYWSEPELESSYRLISQNMDINPRIVILNKKLDYASDVVNILKSHLSEKQSVRLEWMIIWLIMVEVVFETFHFYESLSRDRLEEKTLATVTDSQR